MKILSAHCIGLLAFAHCLRVAMCRYSIINDAVMAPAFITTDSAIHEAGTLAGAVFTEVSNFHDNVVDAVANTALGFLESQGFDYENPQHMHHLISFLENIETDKTSRKMPKFLDEMKKMALKTWHAAKNGAKDTAKQILLSTLSAILKESIKECLPILEKINEKALRTLPINIRVALAPIAYNMWLKFFEKVKIRLPQGFKIENFVCRSIEKEKCDEIINRVKNTWMMKPSTNEVEGMGESQSNSKAVEDSPKK